MNNAIQYISHRITLDYIYTPLLTWLLQCNSCSCDRVTLSDAISSSDCHTVGLSLRNWNTKWTLNVTKYNDDSSVVLTATAGSQRNL